MKVEDIVKNIKADILERIKEKLSEIKGKADEEIYFYDLVTEVIDANIPTDRMECMKIIDHLKHDDDIDEGVIDNSSLDRTLITTSYSQMEIEVNNDEFLQELSQKIENKILTEIQAKKIIKKINEKSKDFGKITHVDTSTQLWMKNVGSLTMDDFKEPFFSKKQMIDLADGSIKILTDNKELNHNAIVIENPSRKEFRIYLMDIEKNVDIQDWFRPEKISASTGYRLDPGFYINGVIKECTKKEFIYRINQMVTDLVRGSMELKCPHCGYKWTSKKLNPKSCPSCKQYLKRTKIVKSG